MLALLADGGPFVWLLLVMSVASVAIVLERGWYLRRSRVMPQPVVDAMETLDAPGLRGTCSAMPSPLARDGPCLGESMEPMRSESHRHGW